MERNEIRTYQCTTVPQAAGADLVIALDTTSGPNAPATAPGTFRGRGVGGRVRGTIAPTGNDLTVVYRELVRRTGASSDWTEVFTTTVAAGDEWEVDYTPAANEYSVAYRAPGAAPTAVDSYLRIEWA